MATNANLPSGAFITTLGTRRCTAVPRSTTSTGASSTGGGQVAATTVATTSSTTSTKALETQTTTAGTTAQALAPAKPPDTAPLNPIAITTSLAQETSTSTTSSIPIPQTTTAQAQAAPPAFVTTPNAITPDTASIASLSSTAQIALTPTLTALSIASTSVSPESELQSQSTKTDNSIAPTSLVGSQIAAPLDTATAQTPALITTIGTATGVSPGAAEITTGSGASVSSSVATTDNNGISTQTTVAVAGGVIGGLVALSLIGFLVWFWRKRSLKKRRSTMLTPLGPESGFGNAGEKAQYSINRTSIGPTTISEKVKATLDNGISKIRGRIGSLGVRKSSSSVNLNRGNSQFIDGSIHSRADSSASDRGQATRTLGTMDRVKGWWSGFSKRSKFNWPVASAPTQSNDVYESSRGMKQNTNKTGLRSQPDFLTLLSMDDNQLAEQANKGRNSMTGAPRRSVSAGSTSHFLGGLGLDFDSANPFSDANAMPHNSARVAPLAVSDTNNPFSDANAVQQPMASKQAAGGPATYVQNIRRSRGQSVGGAAGMRPPSVGNPSGRMDSIYRESGASVESFATRRNKFRSDPFDLDRPELLSSSAGSIPFLGGMSARNSRAAPTTPGMAHMRTESFTSKYSSGVSMGEWSDPGPDVGPGSIRSGSSPTPTGERGEGKEPAVVGRKSGASQVSVGKAY